MKKQFIRGGIAAALLLGATSLHAQTKTDKNEARPVITIKPGKKISPEEYQKLIDYTGEMAVKPADMPVYKPDSSWQAFMPNAFTGESKLPYMPNAVPDKIPRKK